MHPPLRACCCSSPARFLGGTAVIEMEDEEARKWGDSPKSGESDQSCRRTPWNLPNFGGSWGYAPFLKTPWCSWEAWSHSFFHPIPKMGYPIKSPLDDPSNISWPQLWVEAWHIRTSLNPFLLIISPNGTAENPHGSSILPGRKRSSRSKTSWSQRTGQVGPEEVDVPWSARGLWPSLAIVKSRISRMICHEMPRFEDVIAWTKDLSGQRMWKTLESSKLPHGYST